MGFDIHTCCEYKDENGNWVCADGYQKTVYPYAHDRYEVIDPVAEFRNYNLFRPLANIHNTVKHIEFEKSQSVGFYIGAGSVKHTRFVDDRMYREYCPETSEPTDVIESTIITCNDDCSEIAKYLLNQCDDNQMHSVTLDALLKFAHSHLQYTMLNKFANAVRAKYVTINQIRRDNGIDQELAMNDFRVLYGFDS